jgi:hypothetical protein
VAVDVGKVVCCLDGDLLSAAVRVLFKKGSPLLDRFNIITRRYLEAGLLERSWTELQLLAALKGGRRFREAAGDMFFAFCFSHNAGICGMLVGTVLRSVVFIAEVTLNCLWKGRI